MEERDLVNRAITLALERQFGLADEVGTELLWMDQWKFMLYLPDEILRFVKMVLPKNLQLGLQKHFLGSVHYSANYSGIFQTSQ